MCLLPLQLRSLDQYRHHPSRREPELPVPKNSHQTRNSSRVASQTHHASISAFVLEDLIKQLHSPHIMLRMRLAMISLPQLVRLSKTLLNRPLRIRSINLRLPTPPITSMLAHNLSRHLSNQRPKTLQPESSPLQFCSLQTPHQRASNPRVRHRHFLLSKLRFEKETRVTSLLFAHGCEVCVDPVTRSVAVELAPVVVPGFRAVEGFGDVVVTFAVAGEVEEFIGGVGCGGGDEVL
jgi:hypothetical protein